MFDDIPMAQAGVLGSMILDPRCAGEVMTQLRPNDFGSGLAQDTFTAIREMFEETGMEFIPNGDANVNRPFFSSPGMTDESISLVMGRCTGTPTNENQEDSEDIQVVLADKAECLRILSEEAVDVRAAYMIMLFLSWN